MKHKAEKYKLLIIGVIIGIVYAVIARLVWGEKFTLASITFMFLVPTILGMIPLLFANEEQLKSYKNIIFVPWLTVLGSFILLFTGGAEELLCLLVLALPFFILGTIGALLLKLFQLYKKNKRNTLLSLIILPFITAPIEEAITTPSEVYTVKSEVIIDASPDFIWKNIVRVGEIKPNEYTPGTFNYLGIPRPIEAELDSAKTGGKRTGHFEGGLVFNETVTACEPNKKISFDILVDPKTVRNKVFDQHVLNGNYFSFVNATYVLEPINAKQVKLSLISGYRLTSKINFYSRFWGDIILEDFQDRLLAVIKKRCDNHY